VSKRSEIHDRVLQASSLDDIEKAYREWARDYDRDLVGESGYVAPQRCADALYEQLGATDAPVLDAGCGTGLVGQYLSQRGLGTIDGLDYSPDMLKEAEAKGCYRNLLQADLNATLDIPEDTYAAVVCVGTFTSGHVGPDALLKLLRVSAPGAPVCFSVREEFWSASDFSDVVDRAVDRGLAKNVAVEEIPYILSEGSTCRRVLLRAA